MSILDTIAQRLGFVRKGRRSTVGYGAAEMSRLTSSLASEAEFINTTLRYQLRVLRARSRQAVQNNPHARRFVQMAVDNIAGPTPFRLQAKIKNRKNEFDETSNQRIESAWELWGRKGSCELTQRWSWNTLQRLMVRGLATDGEVLLRLYRGPEYGPYGFALQLLDIDRLWEHKNQALEGGGAIHMGVEVDSISRPVAYHLLKRKPAQWQNSGYGLESERVPADEVLHIFVPDFAEQCRGVPWMYAALLNLVHIGAFEEAAVIAARVGATQMGFLQSPDGDAPNFGDGKDAKGNPQIEAEAGTFPVLPPGYELSNFAPKYPDAAVGPFITAMLRGMAAGLGVAYHNLAGDMEGVNYSSARIAELDERDAWLGLQTFLVEHCNQPIYDDWLRMSIIAGTLPFDLARLDKYRAVKWQARRWAWVDPQKEVQAQLSAIEGRLRSRTGVIAEMGEDIEDVLDEIAQEEKMAADMGIAFPAVKPAVATPAAAGDGAESADGTSDTTTAKAIAAQAAAITKVAEAIAKAPAPQIHNHVTPAPVTVNQGDMTFTVEGRGAVVKEITERDKDGLVKTMTEKPIERAA